VRVWCSSPDALHRRGQTQDVKDEVCGGLASSPDEYYALMKDTWLEDADMEPELFGALMTTIINDCGL